MQNGHILKIFFRENFEEQDVLFQLLYGRDCHSLRERLFYWHFSILATEITTEQRDRAMSAEIKLQAAFYVQNISSQCHTQKSSIK